MAISEFQLSIIALGVLSVAGVIAYNRWQEYKYRKNTERGFSASHADVLLDAREPVVEFAADDARGSDDRIEPVDVAVPDEAQVAAHAEEAKAMEEPAMPLVHPLADWVVPFDAADPIASDQLWQAARDALANVNKPVRFLGWNDAGKLWQLLEDNAALNWRQWRIAVQLADRHGALDGSGVEAVLRGVHQLADRFAAATEIPDVREIERRAQELDEFCASVDVQIGLHVVANDAAGFSAARLRIVAEAAGMMPGANGTFQVRDAAGSPLYTMGTLEPVPSEAEGTAAAVGHGFTFSLDVPRVAQGGEAFDAMVAAAQQLAAELNGIVVDDNRAPLGQKSLDRIRAKIVEFQDLMSRQGIVAGSATAQRLFR